MAHSLNVTDKIIPERVISVQMNVWCGLPINTIYYADSFKHEGSDIAVGNTNMWVGCEFSYQIPSQSTNWFQYNAGTPIYETGNFTINSYNYSITENDVSTFNKTPDKVYRLVDENGNLIRQGVNPADGEINLGTTINN